MRRILKALILSPLLLVAGPVAADEVFLLNGDRLTGKIVSATGGKLILNTDAAGEITIDLAKVKTFSAEAPVQLQLGGKTLVESRVAAGPEGEVQGEIPPGSPAQPLSIKGITAINPPPSAWHGAFALNGLLTTGNSETQQLGFTASASKRWEDDRLSLGAEYAYGRQTDHAPGRGARHRAVRHRGERAVGHQAARAELGTDVGRGYRFMRLAPWLVFIPGSVILLTTLAFNMVGDGMRDALDPRQARER